MSISVHAYINVSVFVSVFVFVSVYICCRYADTTSSRPIRISLMRKLLRVCTARPSYASLFLLITSSIRFFSVVICCKPRGRGGHF